MWIQWTIICVQHFTIPPTLPLPLPPEFRLIVAACMLQPATHIDNPDHVWAFSHSHPLPTLLSSFHRFFLLLLLFFLRSCVYLGTWVLYGFHFLKVRAVNTSSYFVGFVKVCLPVCRHSQVPVFLSDETVWNTHFWLSVQRVFTVRLLLTYPTCPLLLSNPFLFQCFIIISEICRSRLERSNFNQLQMAIRKIARINCSMLGILAEFVTVFLIIEAFEDLHTVVQCSSS